ncbi:hypothetical protein OOZ63_25225 [Paucibacter sp. PLA-PC-4]|uniref:hypothetical protein n=1 Tax=Paucibacter sp. PLA-PC-4 TaxID=2993655 RepID=UPI00224B225F|nr:hypothetical protein [Paucibacter sp. PLA-PC-4]MCX2865135.1 hypothetical protein [Paucibacter sp. PLA-PC-4]
MSSSLPVGLPPSSAPIRRSGYSLTPLLICIGALPSLLMYFGITTSLSIGTLLAGAIALAMLPNHRLGRFPERSFASYLLILCAALSAHLLIASALGPVDFVRAFGSMAMLAVGLAGAVSVAMLLAGTQDEQIRTGARKCLLALGIVAALGILKWFQPDTVTWGKSVFPFTEPSHLALFAAPILIFTCVISKPSTRIGYLAATLLITALLQNITLVAICVVTAVLCLRVRHLVLMSAIVVPAVLGTDLTYYLDRLDFSGDSQNLSNLVFFQGWQLLIESMEATQGFGRGFQQLGVFGTDASAAELIYVLMQDYLNLLDGGFTLSKLVSEFGVFGIALLGIYAKYAWQAAVLLRRVAFGRARPPAVLALAASSIVAFAFELLLRGSGYFTPTTLLLAASLVIWHRYHRQAKPPATKRRAEGPSPATVS